MIDSSFDVVRRRTRPVMIVHALVVPANARCISGSITKLVHPVELNAWWYVNTGVGWSIRSRL